MAFPFLTYGQCFSHFILTMLAFNFPAGVVVFFMRGYVCLRALAYVRVFFVSLYMCVFVYFSCVSGCMARVSLNMCVIAHLC